MGIFHYMWKLKHRSEIETVKRIMQDVGGRLTEKGYDIRLSDVTYLAGHDALLVIFFGDSVRDGLIKPSRMAGVLHCTDSSIECHINPYNYTKILDAALALKAWAEDVEPYSSAHYVTLEKENSTES